MFLYFNVSRSLLPPQSNSILSRALVTLSDEEDSICKSVKDLLGFETRHASDKVLLVSEVFPFWASWGHWGRGEAGN
jgi:urocanate hydratase